MIDIEREKLGNKLKEAREYLGLSQEEVAAVLKLSRSAISLFEAGKRRVDAIELQKLSNIYNKSISDLTGQSKEESLIVEHLAREASGLTEKDQQELMEFARFLKSRSENKQSD